MRTFTQMAVSVRLVETLTPKNGPSQNRKLTAGNAL